ncbi:TPM domain-containing protein [Microaerobacter geothermalis]|uniref:septation ring formation regulator EzrA n=1 Tax=Microaerobacter geothermalis TaxID=674972 RepID=UPI001F1E438A|nr:septation ring formation regulator EzrA [Microaerobacter geothermalis]MCF6094930.1 TPM domain-containing protein [Microaerobacter geothermalis]
MKKTFLAFFTFILFIGFLFITETGYSAELPEKTDEVVQDEADFFKRPEKEQITSLVNQLPEEYKIVVVKETSPLTIDQFTDELFDTYNISDNGMLIVINSSDNTIAIKPGSQLEKNGINKKMILDKLSFYYTPYAKEGNYATGILTFIQQISEEVQKSKIKKEKEQGTVVDGNPLVNKEVKKGYPLWFIIFLTLLFIVLVFGLIIYWRRKRLLSAIDSMEEWKDQLNEQMANFVLSEKNEVKKYEGETKQLLINTLDQANHILEKGLPEIEVQMMEAEEYCDRFRFKKGWYLIDQMEIHLKNVESQLESMKGQFKEVESTQNHTIDLSMKVKKEKEAVKTVFNQLKTKHHVTFDSFANELEKLEKWENRLVDLMQGNDVVATYGGWAELYAHLEKLHEYILSAASLYHEVEQELKNEMTNLQDLIAEFRSEGVRVDYILTDEQLKGMEEQRLRLLVDWEEGQFEKLKEKMDRLKSQMTEWITRLKQEKENKEQVIDLFHRLPEWLSVIDHERGIILKELEHLHDRYQLDEGELFDDFRDFDSQVNQVKEKLHRSTGLIKEHLQSFSDSLAQLKEIEGLIEELDKRKNQILGLLNNLKKDEDEIKENMLNLSKQLRRAVEEMKRSRLPGIPDHIINGVHIAQEMLHEVDEKMQEAPLDIKKVSFLFQEANTQVTNTVEMIYELVELCIRSEEAIQYGNRYRRESDQINQLLTDAEKAFRQFDYQQSLSLAEEAIELAEGNRVKRWLSKRKKNASA